MPRSESRTHRYPAQPGPACLALLKLLAACLIAGLVYGYPRLVRHFLVAIDPELVRAEIAHWWAG